MKKIGNFIFDIVVCVWLVVAIFVTVCLLSYNEFSVSTFGRTTLLIIDSDEMEPDYVEGDLLVVKRGSDNKIEPGDKIFYYNSAMNSNVLIYYNVVQSKEPITRDETTFVIDDEKVSGEYVIGKSTDAKVYHKAGTFLKIFSSRWGYMFLVIFPTLFAIIYEIMMIVDARREIKMEKQMERQNEGQN